MEEAGEGKPSRLWGRRWSEGAPSLDLTQQPAGSAPRQDHLWVDDRRKAGAGRFGERIRCCGSKAAEAAGPRRKGSTHLHQITAGAPRPGIPPAQETLSMHGSRWYGGKLPKNEQPPSRLSCKRLQTQEWQVLVSRTAHAEQQLGGRLLKRALPSQSPLTHAAGEQRKRHQR